MEEDLSKSNILIVDDIKSNIDLLVSMLKNEYQFGLATNGLSALDYVDNNHVDLILLDIMMPEMDGFKVCEILKDKDETKDIPVIFITAKTDSDSIVQGFELGGVDFLKKPFNSKELLARVKTHIELKNVNEKLTEMNIQLGQANSAKNRFFSIIAHDLKNPLNNLLGFSDILYDQYKYKYHQLSLLVLSK